MLALTMYEANPRSAFTLLRGVVSVPRDACFFFWIICRFSCNVRPLFLAIHRILRLMSFEGGEGALRILHIGRGARGTARDLFAEEKM